MGEVQNSYISDGEIEGKRPLGKCRHTQEDIRVNSLKIVCIHLVLFAQCKT
jgi:hypothetical protein